MVINEGEVKVVNIGSNLQYDIVFTDGSKTLLLANTTVIGKRTGANIVEMKPIDDGPKPALECYNKATRMVYKRPFTAHLPTNGYQLRRRRRHHTIS